MKLTEIKEVIKASPAIQIESKITLLQRRMWNVLLANAYNELPDKETHHVSVSELAEKIGLRAPIVFISKRRWRHLLILQSSGMFWKKTKSKSGVPQVC